MYPCQLAGCLLACAVNRRESLQTPFDLSTYLYVTTYLYNRNSVLAPPFDRLIREFSYPRLTRHIS
jgi:hypothetical protein